MNTKKHPLNSQVKEDAQHDEPEALPRLLAHNHFTTCGLDIQLQKGNTKMSKMVMISEERYNKMMETYDQMEQELRELKAIKAYAASPMHKKIVDRLVSVEDEKALSLIWHILVRM